VGAYKKKGRKKRRKGKENAYQRTGEAAKRVLTFVIRRAIREEKGKRKEKKRKKEITFRTVVTTNSRRC